MSGFPLTNVRISFHDLNHDPLVGGKLYTKETGPGADKNIYKDADLAVAHTNPVILDSRGEAPQGGLFADAGQKFYLKLTDSDDVTIWEEDNVEFPNLVTQANIGLKLYPQTQAESDASVTPTNYFYLPGNAKRLGATGDGSTDESSALQDWINVASYDVRQKVISLPAGKYKHLTPLYYHYDVTNNPGYNSNTGAFGNIVIEGEGETDYQAHVSNSIDVGSIMSFEPSGGTGDGHIIGDGTNNSRGVRHERLSIVGNTSGRLLFGDIISRQSGTNYVFGYNSNAAGSGFEWRSIHNVTVENTRITGPTGQSTGLGLKIWSDATNGGGGNVVLKQVSVRDFDYGYTIGDPDGTDSFTDSDSVDNLYMQACTVRECKIGYRIANVNSGCMDTCYMELYTEIGLRISRSTTCFDVDGCYIWGPAATVADIQLGEIGPDLTTSTYRWTASGSGTNEYYVELTGGGDPGLETAVTALLDGAFITAGTVGSLADHEWDWGDNDTLGYSTVYFRDNSGDPDASGVTVEMVSDTLNRHGQITIRGCRHGQVKTRAYYRISTSSCESVRIINPRLNPETASAGIGFDMDDVVQHGLEIIRPEYVDTFATEIAFPARADVHIAAGSLGDVTYEADVHIGGSFVHDTVNTFPTSDATPSISAGNVWTTGDTGTITDFDDGEAGKIITVVHAHAHSIDVTGTDLNGGSADITAADGDVSMWLCVDGTVWRLISFMNDSADQET